MRVATILSRNVTSVLGITALLAPAVGAQGRVVEDDEWCRQSEERHRGWFCEVREITLGAERGVLAVNARPNGGIRVEGWERNEVRVRARVSARADTDREAQALVSEVEVQTGERTVESVGPRTGGDEWWSVSYRISVPHRSDLSLETLNGGITIVEVVGDLEFETTNGGIRLAGVGGDVRGRTTNGGVAVELTGDAWQGDGLDVRTTNGGVQLAVPEDYSAHLEAGTTNGGMRFAFPIMVQGRLDRRIAIDLGEGGRPIRVMTTNGGVVVRRP